MTEPDQSVSAKRVRDVVALGKSCSKTSFPNPTREGCPDYSTLRAMAFRDRRLSLSELPVSHVVRCSPCFQHYARLRRMSLLVRGVQTTAASLIVLAILLAAVRLVWNYTSGRVEPSISREHRIEPQSPVAIHQAAPSIAPLAITVNLASFSPTRGEEAKESANRIHLPAKVLHVRFLLPVGMEPGEYAFRLQGPAGTVLKEIRTAGRLNDGITSLEVDLDLTAVSRGSLSLMIRPPGLSWRTFPVLVE
jgi:hypothetical protein